jgi:hypothetical protein
MHTCSIRAGGRHYVALAAAASLRIASARLAASAGSAAGFISTASAGRTAIDDFSTALALSAFCVRATGKQPHEKWIAPVLFGNGWRARWHANLCILHACTECCRGLVIKAREAVAVSPRQAAEAAAEDRGPSRSCRLDRDGQLWRLVVHPPWPHLAGGSHGQTHKPLYRVHIVNLCV